METIDLMNVIFESNPIEQFPAHGERVEKEKERIDSRTRSVGTDTSTIVFLDLCSHFISSVHVSI